MYEFIWGSIAGVLFMAALLFALMKTPVMDDTQYCAAYGAAVNDYHGKDYCYVAE